jgi:hypothetical protein
MSAAAEETHHAEQITEVVPGAVVVDFVDVEVRYKERDHEDEWGNEALPQACPEAGDGVFVIDRAFQSVGARCAGGQDEEHQEGEDECRELHGECLQNVLRVKRKKRLRLRSRQGTAHRATKKSVKKLDRKIYRDISYDISSRRKEKLKDEHKNL